MGLDVFLQDDSLLIRENDAYLEYMKAHPPSLEYLGTLEWNDWLLLDPWVEECQTHGLSVGHFYDDTMISWADAHTIIALLEQFYYRTTGSKLHKDYAPSDRRGEAFHVMHRFLQQAIDSYRGMIWLCD